MTLTADQKLAIKKHLGEHPTSTILDPFIATVTADADVENELINAITACNTALTNLETAQAEADELVEGGGAKFSYERRIAIKQRAYRDRVWNLVRIIAWPMPCSQAGGFLSL